jgi:L-threonylcarbamoyladenylate synthase
MDIKKAVELLKEENVVGMPTETVYGLAGSIQSENALKKIFQIKGRPFFDPLIVHVASIEAAKSLVLDWPLAADLLAKKFWPGPLTLVLEKNKNVSNLISSGLSTVAIRMPNHPVALELIKTFGTPLAAPSANKFGKTSPTTKAHVESEFKNDHLKVLEGGPCQIGIESTVLKIQQKHDTTELAILRAGSITFSDIKDFLTLNKVEFSLIEKIDKGQAPGQMKHHYMPNKPLVLIQDFIEENDLKIKIKNHFNQIPDYIESVKIIKPQQINSFKELLLSDSPEIAARQLYAKLREVSEGPEDIIFFKIEPWHSGEKWEAFFDRINKAASLIIKS